MLQKTYSIYSEDLESLNLFIEAGKKFIACWCKNDETNQLHAFEFFQCEPINNTSFENVFEEAKLHSKLLTTPASKTNFIWNIPETICLPSKFIDKEDNDFVKENFNLLYGPLHDSSYIKSQINDYVFASRIDKKLHEKATAVFSKASFFIQPEYLKFFLLNSNGEENIHLFFYPGSFIIIANKNSVLQLFQNRMYDDSQEVLYYLLNVITQFNFKNDVPVTLGGFIDQKSKLFDLLYQYIEGLQLASIDENLFAGNEFKNYAPHYFLPFAKYNV